jgi:DNA polymerase-3 subunit beta
VKITCKKADLSRGLAVVGRAIAARTTLPILANVKLSVEQGRLRLAATNLELGIQCWVDATVEEAGSTTLPAKILTDFVNFLPHSDITIITQQDTHESLIKSDISSASVKGMDPEEFPFMPTIDGDPALLIDAATFKTMVDDIGFAAARNDDRPTLTGIYLEVQEGVGTMLTCAAADTYRLAVENCPLARESDPISLLVPAKTLRDLAAILPAQGQVEIGTTSNGGQVLFHTEGIDLASRLLESSYVNFRQMLPKDYQIQATLETRMFTSVIKTAALFASAGDHSVTLMVQPRAGTITIEASATDLGSNTTSMTAQYGDTATASDLTILFNVRYLAEVLSAMSDAPEMAIELRTHVHPGILKPAATRDVLYLVMPQTKRKPAQPTHAAAAL